MYSSPSIVFFIFFPANLAQKFKKSFFFLFSYISLATKPIKLVRFTNTKTCPQIYKTQKHSTIYCHFFTFPLQTQRPSRIQNTFNKPRVLTRFNPNLQTQANPNSKNPKLKIAFLFLTNSDLHFALSGSSFSKMPLSKTSTTCMSTPILPSTSPTLRAPSSNSASFRRKKLTATR